MTNGYIDLDGTGNRAPTDAEVAASAVQIGAYNSISMNAFSPIKVALARGQDAHLGICSDSTGNEHGDGVASKREWPYLFADQFAAANAGIGVICHQWEEPTGTSSTSYSATTIVIQAATGSNPTLHIWVAGVASTTPQYFMGSSWFASMVAIPLDCLIVNHGHNLVGVIDDSCVRGEIVSFIEQFKLYRPGVPISWICQNPRQTDTQLTTVVEQIKRCAQMRDVAIIDVHSAWIAAGGKTNPAFYDVGGTDNVHPSQLGQTFWETIIWQHYLQAASILAPARPSLLSMPVPTNANLLVNGDFRAYPSTPGLPTGWSDSGSGTTTVSKDTGGTYPVADTRQGYSVNVTDTTVAAYITQALSSALYIPLRGSRVTLAVLRYVNSSAPSTTARIALKVGSPTGGLTVTASSRGYTTRQNGWVWWVISGLFVPLDCNQIQVYLHHNTSTPGATPYSAGYDQACLLPGYLPGAAR
jgi:hypothetical protein